MRSVGVVSLLLLAPSASPLSPGSPAICRRGFGGLAGGALVSVLLPPPSIAAGSNDERFDPLDYVNKETLNSFGGASAQPVGVGTMSSRARPVTNVKVVDGTLTSTWEESGKSKKAANGVQAELEVGGGNVRVQFASPWKLNRGMFYDVETRGEGGDGCYLHVGRKAPAASSSDKDVARWIAESVTAKSSRFGANGGVTLKTIMPAETVMNADGQAFRDTTFFFDTLSPSMRELPRRARVRASWPPRGGESVMLVLQGGVGEAYKKGVKPYEELIMTSFATYDVKSGLKNRKKSDTFGEGEEA